MPQKKHLHLSKGFVLLAPLVDYRSNRFYEISKSLEMKKPLNLQVVFIINKILIDIASYSFAGIITTSNLLIVLIC